MINGLKEFDEITIVCLTKDGLLYQSCPLSQNSWSLGNIPIVSVL